jgi:hypothetical protein
LLYVRVRLEATGQLCQVGNQYSQQICGAQVKAILRRTLIVVEREMSDLCCNHPADQEQSRALYLLAFRFELNLIGSTTDKYHSFRTHWVPSLLEWDFPITLLHLKEKASAFS